MRALWDCLSGIYFISEDNNDDNSVASDDWVLVRESCAASTHRRVVPARMHGRVVPARRCMQERCGIDDVRALWDCLSGIYFISEDNMMMIAWPVMIAAGDAVSTAGIVGWTQSVQVG